MTDDLAGKMIAILAANGFDENHMTAIQRIFSKAKAQYKVIAPEQGLVNGWQGSGWGHYFTVDSQINAALGSDFDALVIVGGERGVSKLKTNPHARRIVNHFLEARKPVAAIGAGVALLSLSGRSAGLEVAAPAEFHEEIRAAKMTVAAEEQHIDGVVLSAVGKNMEMWAESALALFGSSAEMERAA